MTETADHLKGGPDLLVANARRVVETLAPALAEGRIAVHLIPTDDFGGEINHVLPEELIAHCENIVARGRHWQIIPAETIQADLDHAHRTIDWYGSLESGFK